MTAPVVSIIVPIYNMESHLRRCLDSIAAQTFANYECLLIDDGSTDGSPAICDEYAAADGRFRVVHTPNGGLGAARNCGLDRASGRYIANIDPDDWVEPCYLETLVCAASRVGEWSVVIAAYYEDTNGDSRYVSNNPSALSVAAARCDLLRGRVHPGLWNKLLPRIIFADHGVRWPRYGFGEGQYVSQWVLRHASGVVCVPTAAYHYCVNPQSLTNDPDHAVRFRMDKEFLLNMADLDTRIHLSADNALAEAFRCCVLGTKVRAVRLHRYPCRWLRELMPLFPYAMGLRHCRGLRDVLFWLASRYCFLLPYRVRELLAWLLGRSG